MNLSKILFFVGLLYGSISAEVIGNLEFQPPVSLEEWTFFEDSTAEGKVLFKNYGHTSSQVTEILMTSSAVEFPGPLSHFSYYQLPDIKAFLTKRMSGFHDQVSFEDIIVEPKSIFYKTIVWKDKQVYGYIWSREIVNETNWLTFQYIISLDDSTFDIKQLDSIAKPWIIFLKEGLLEKATYLKKDLSE